MSVTLEMLKTYLLRYRPYRWQLLLSAALSVFQPLMLGIQALLIKIAFDRILARETMTSIALACGAILLAASAAAAMALTARHLSLRATKLVVRDLRLELFSRSFWLAPVSATADLAPLHTVIVQDTERLDVGSIAVIAIALPAVVTAAIFLAAMIVLAPALLLATLCAVPLAFLSHRLLGRRLQGLVMEFRSAFESLDEKVYGALERLDLTRIRGAETEEATRQADAVENLRRTSGRMAWTATAYSQAQGLILSTVGVVTLLIGGTAFAANAISLSSLAAYYFALTQLGASLNSLWNAAPQILAGMDSLAGIARLETREAVLPAGGTRHHLLGGDLAVHALSFSYGPAPLLRGLDLSLSPGQQAAIMGRNGSGKSTLLHLLLGLRSPSAGDVLIDAIPIMELSLPDYRRQIGVVLQGSQLFPGTVYDNIVYGHANATPEAVSDAVRLSGADGFLQTLSGGLQASVEGLSSGQGQLVGLARALLGRPPLLLLDEPTSHLDDTTVAALFDRLDRGDYRPTIVLITHDLKLAGRFSLRYELRKGVLVPTFLEG